MAVKLRNISEQVIVITGASSGIGLVTARMAASQGARLVVAARSEEPLRELVEEIRAGGGQAEYVVADVSDEEDVRRIADAAKEHFGGFDTWVNNAGVSIYGRLMEVPIEEQRQLLETNFWGLVYGSRVAVEHLRLHGGALINIGSVLSDRAIPLQGIYCASKHAVRGFTDSLRMELEQEGAPISVTLIKPSAIDTPYRQHARNYLAVEPKNVPIVYAPELVAEAILHAAERPERELTVGGSGKLLILMGKLAPRLTDLFMEKTMFRAQKTDRPPQPPEAHALYASQSEGHERGGSPGHVAEHSPATRASLYHPVLLGAVLLAVGAAVAALQSSASRRPTRGPIAERLREHWPDTG